MAAARPHHASIGETVAALVHAPYVSGLGSLLEGSRVGRHRKHPTWVPTVYAALARHFRSANRLDGELMSGLWCHIRQVAAAAELEDPGERPYTYAQHAYWRDRVVCDPERREELLDAFSTLAIAHARETGLLLPIGKGSLTHPSPARTIYGDGTVVRPIYCKAPESDDEEGDGAEAEAEESGGAGDDTERPRRKQSVRTRAPRCSTATTA